jgi:hypothetical protein
MPNQKKTNRRKPDHARLVYAGALYVTPARLESMKKTHFKTWQTVSQQAAAALDVSDPLPAPQKESTG